MATPKKSPSPSGSACPQARFTEDQVREIRRRYQAGHPQHGCTPMAREFGVGASTMSQLISGRSWKHVV